MDWFDQRKLSFIGTNIAVTLGTTSASAKAGPVADSLGEPEKHSCALDCDTCRARDFPWLTQGTILDGVAVLATLPGVGVFVEDCVELDLANLKRCPFKE